MASAAPHFSGNGFRAGSDSRSENANVTGSSNVRESAAAREIKKVLVWENPLVSLSYFVGVHVLFWFLIYTELKFYGLMFVALLMLTLRQLWNDQFQSGNSSPEFRPCSSTESDGNPVADDDGTLLSVNRIFDECWEAVKSISRQLRRLRQQQPRMFCVFVCTLFLTLGIVGRTLSNVALLYLFVLTVMTVPAILVRLLPPGILQLILNLSHSSHEESESVSREEDYLPEANSETLDLLRLASDLSLTDDEDDEDDDFLLDHLTCRTNDTADSFCSKFSALSGTCTHMADDNLSCLACEFNLGQSMERTEYSDESENSEINFVSKHFNGDSSDDEDLSDGSELNGHVLEEESRVNLLDAINTGAASGTLSESQIRQEREASSETESFEEVTEEDI